MTNDRDQRPTQKTIAKLAGLAVTTVSRALAGDPKIARSTRDHVAKVAASVGYMPDRAAQRLRTGKTKLISLILDPHPEILGFGNSLIVGVTAALRDTGYHLNITPHFTDNNAAEPVHHIVRNRLADGVIFSRTEPFDDRVQFLMENEFPFTCHGRTEFSAPHASVDFDNVAFARLAVERLASKGARSICMILPQPHLTFSNHLRYGAQQAASATGVDVLFPDDISLDDTPAKIEHWAREFRSTRPDIDGFVCAGEASCLSISAGYAGQPLPHFVVKDTSPFMAQINPNADRIFEDIELAGRTLGERLLTQLEGGNLPEPVLFQPKVSWED